MNAGPEVKSPRNDMVVWISDISRGFHKATITERSPLPTYTRAENHSFFRLPRARQGVLFPLRGKPGAAGPMVRKLEEAFGKLPMFFEILRLSI